MTRQLLLSAAMLASLAACGGGGSSLGNAYGGVPISTPAPPTSGALTTATLNGSPGFVSASGRTAYVFDADTTANQSTCNAGNGCSGIWPAILVTAGATLPTNWTSFTRADGTTQLAYKGRPVYTYSGDSAAGQINGDGITSFGATWHIARP